ERWVFDRVVGPFGFGRSFEGGRNIRAQFNDLTKQHESELLNLLPEAQRTKLEELRTKDDRGANARYMVVLGYELWRPGGHGEKLFTSEELKPLIAQLPEEYKRSAGQAKEVPEQMKIIRSWIDDAGRSIVNRPRNRGRGGQGRPPRQEDLDRFR